MGNYKYHVPGGRHQGNVAEGLYRVIAVTGQAVRGTVDVSPVAPVRGTVDVLHYLQSEVRHLHHLAETDINGARFGEQTELGANRERSVVELPRASLTVSFSDSFSDCFSD